MTLTTALLALTLLGDTTEVRRVVVAPAESIYVELSGAGQPVVLIPGLFGSAFGYRQLVPLLTRAGYRTIAIEPLGIGRSSRPEQADYSSTAQAERIAAVLDRLEVRGALAIAHSVGGSQAFRLAYRRPDLVAGILSLEGGPAEAVATSGFRFALRLAPAIKLAGGRYLLRQAIRQQLIDASGDTRWITEEVVMGYTGGAAVDLGSTLKAYRAMANAREPEPLGPRLPEIRAPVILLLGAAKHDGGPSRQEIELLQRSLPSFSQDSIRGVGHYLHEEQPAQVLAALQRLRQRVSER